jgi:hypothetical protein
MKAFFKQCLDELEQINGCRQLFYIQSDPDGKKKIEVLLAGMIEASNQFPYIPQEAQEGIIKKMMRQDQDYQELNSRTIWKWLDLHKGKYQLEPNKEEYPIQTNELSEETKRMIKDYLNELATGFKIPPMTRQDIEREGQERLKMKGASYIPNPEYAVERILHVEYLKANYHPITQERLPGWMSENEWLKLNR